MSSTHAIAEVAGWSRLFPLDREERAISRSPFAFCRSAQHPQRLIRCRRESRAKSNPTVRLLRDAGLETLSSCFGIWHAEFVRAVSCGLVGRRAIRDQYRVIVTELGVGVRHRPKAGRCAWWRIPSGSVHSFALRSVSAGSSRCCWHRQSLPGGKFSPFCRRIAPSASSSAPHVVAICPRERKHTDVVPQPARVVQR